MSDHHADAGDERPDTYRHTLDAVFMAGPGPLPPDFDHDKPDLRPQGESVWRRWRGPLLHVALLVTLVVMYIAIWWFAVYLGLWPRVLLPSPVEVWDALIRTSVMHDGSGGFGGFLLWEHLWASMRRILFGSGAAIVLGVPIGLLLGTSRLARTLFEPGVTFLRALPPLAYFYLLVVWFGIDETPKVLLLLLAALPPIVLATSDAVRNVPQDRLLALQTLGASKYQLVRHGVFLSALPEVITGIRVAVLFAFTTVVAAETINGVPGIGGVARDAQRYGQTDIVIMAVFVIGICGIVLDLIIQVLDRLLIPWRAR